MGAFRSLLTFLTGVIGGAGAAAYLLTRQQTSDRRHGPSSTWAGARSAPAASLASLGQPTRMPPSAALSAAPAAESELLAQRAQELEIKLKDQEQSIAALQEELSMTQAWHAKVPTLARFGQTLAKLPSFKAAAADAAIAATRMPSVTGDYDDLAAVYGIGAAYEQRLYAAGVGTFWEIAHLSDDDFRRILRPTPLQRATLDLDAIRADANRLALASNSVGLLWSGDTPDDFEPIKGIGPVFEQKLYDAGIRTYRALAVATVEELAAICGSNLRVQPDFADWIVQAQQLSQSRI